MPEDGYHGDYINDLARQVVAENPGITDLPEGERMVAFRDAGYAIQLAEQQQQLANFRTHFDVWFSERSLHDERRGHREHREAPRPGPPLRGGRRPVDAYDGRGRRP